MIPLDSTPGYHTFPTGTANEPWATNATSTTITFSSWTHTDSWPSVEIILDPKAEKLRLAREASKQAVARARAALKAALTAPTASVPRCWRQPQKPLYARPVSKGRVCASSSRYRVLMRSV